jgi:membrane protein DedA with SNARE-associated domain
VLNDLVADPAAALEALRHLADARLVALALVLTTLLVEDLAIAAGAALAAQGAVSWPLAFVAVAGGIALGDLGLYALGAGARRVRWLERRCIGPRSHALRERLQRRLGRAVLLARVVPGLRLVTYTASGFLRVGPLPFASWVVAAASAWTAALFVLGSTLGGWLAAVLPIPAPLAVALAAVVAVLAVPLLRRRTARVGSPR